MLLSKKFIGHLGFMLGLIFQAQVFAKAEFNFAVNSPGSPPYLYIDPLTNQYTGVIVDIISTMANQHQIQVNYIDSHRSRTESFIYKGLIDGTLSSSKWLTHPEKLISTISIVDHNSYVYSMSAFADNFKLSDLNNSRVCMRRGYVYPSFEKTQGLDNFQRIDSSEQFSMMQMLVKNRCNYAVMHEYNANSIIFSPAYKNVKIYRSAYPHDIAKLSIFLRPELTTLKEMLDLAITTMNNDGSLDVSLNFHMQNIL